MNDAYPHRHYNGDLLQMDAGELREHLAAYVARHGRDDYTAALITFVAEVTGISVTEIEEDLAADVEAL
jgi:hypothetical protein